MAADFVPAPRPGLAHHLLLPAHGGSAGSSLEEVAHGLGPLPPAGPVVLHAADWSLTLPELRTLQRQLQDHGLALCRVESRVGETLVAASALGLPTGLPHTDGREPPGSEATREPAADGGPEVGLLIHRGTLRSGDHLQGEGSVLLLGDVNPGARVSAGGHVLVWGRLRGVAHAGCRGDGSARIVALQLRPLQLRIADVVARGPEDLPPNGFSEQARLVDGTIEIDPAEPLWPLPD